MSDPSQSQPSTSAGGHGPSGTAQGGPAPGDTAQGGIAPVVQQPKQLILLSLPGVRRLFRIHVFRVNQVNETSPTGYMMQVVGSTKAGQEMRLNIEKTVDNHYLRTENDPTYWFWAIIPSICYVGSITVPAPAQGVILERDLQNLPGRFTANEWPFEMIGTESAFYFRYIHRQQLGAHLNIGREGQVGIVRTFLDKKSRYDCKHKTNISSLYPIIQNRFEMDENTRKFVTLEQTLALGLVFLARTDIWNWCEQNEDQVDRIYVTVLNERYYFESNGYQNPWAGELEQHRYYHRYDDHTSPLNCGNVYELTEHMLRDVSNEGIIEGKRFAIYVCAGAKLYSVDTYHELAYNPTLQKQKHNRSLIQQGGLIMGEGSLRFSMPMDAELVQSYLKGGKNILPGLHLTLEQMVIWNVFGGENMTEQQKQRIRGIQNPVIFLGANESDYDTICWGLEVYRPDIRTAHSAFRPSIEVDREFHLAVPEGGRIVAIEEWSAGIAEVWSRHRYEQLYKSVVRLEEGASHTYSATEFASPERDVFKKLLGVDPHHRRSIDIVIPRFGYNPQPGTNLPKEFNFYEPSPADPVNIGDLAFMEGKAPNVCPAYPPVHIEGKFAYLPSNFEFGSTNIEKVEVNPVYANYPLDLNLRTKGNWLLLRHGADRNAKFVLKQRPLDEFRWEKYMGEIGEDGQPVPDDDGRQISNLYFRLGVDGYYYQKSEKSVGQYKTWCYEHQGWVDDQSNRRKPTIADRTRMRSPERQPKPKPSETREANILRSIRGKSLLKKSGNKPGQS